MRSWHAKLLGSQTLLTTWQFSGCMSSFLSLDWVWYLPYLFHNELMLRTCFCTCRSEFRIHLRHLKNFFNDLHCLLTIYLSLMYALLLLLQDLTAEVSFTAQVCHESSFCRIGNSSVKSQSIWLAVFYYTSLWICEDDGVCRQEISSWC